MFFYIYIICLNENAVSEFINYSSKMCLHSSQQSVKMLNSLLEKQFWKRGHQLTFAQMWFFFFFFFEVLHFPGKEQSALFLHLVLQMCLIYLSCVIVTVLSAGDKQTTCSYTVNCVWLPFSLSAERLHR